MAWLATLGGMEVRASRVLPRSADAAAIESLERRAATASDAPAVTALASTYLDHEQPGLATAVIERASHDVRSEPEVAYLYARSLFHRGRTREALAVARDAADRCDEQAECSARIVAKTTRQVAFLEQVVAAGIDDPARDPSATQAAYERSAHAVRLVAMR